MRVLREFKAWGGRIEKNDPLYIWAENSKDAIEIARLIEQDICITQWTGKEEKM